MLAMYVRMLLFILILLCKDKNINNKAYSESTYTIVGPQNTDLSHFTVINFSQPAIV